MKKSTRQPAYQCQDANGNALHIPLSGSDFYNIDSFWRALGIAHADIRNGHPWNNALDTLTEFYLIRLRGKGEKVVAILYKQPNGTFGSQMPAEPITVVAKQQATLDQVIFLTNQSCDVVYKPWLSLLRSLGIQTGATHPLTEREQQFIGEDEVVFGNGTHALILGSTVVYKGEKMLCPMIEIGFGGFDEGTKDEAVAEANRLITLLNFETTIRCGHVVQYNETYEGSRGEVVVLVMLPLSGIIREFKDFEDLTDRLDQVLGIPYEVPAHLA